MFSKSTKKWQNITEASIIKLLFILTLFGILAFLTIEYVFNIPPCVLCKIQRIPYYMATFLCIISSFKICNLKYIIYAIMICFFFAFGVAIFHFLVEEKIFTFPCTEVIKASNILELRRQMENVALSCNVPVKVFGARITIISGIYNLFVLLFSYRLYKVTNIK